MKLSDILDISDIELIHDKFISLIKKLDIFHNLNFLNSRENYVEAIYSYLLRKNNFKNLIDPIVSDMQFNNIAGFELIDSGAGRIHSKYIPPKNPDNTFEYKYQHLPNKKIEDKWHSELLKVLENVFFDNSKNMITCLNEEWHNYNVKTKDDEFVTLVKSPKTKKKGLGNVIKPVGQGANGKCGENELTYIIKHRLFQISNKILVINIHTSSSMNGKKVADQIATLLDLYKKKYKDKIIILGGDSNIYYGKMNPGKNNGISDINYFYSKLKKLGYKMLISRHIVAKYRPYNYFQNAQSASKGGLWTNEETMFISLPNKIDIEYDETHYFLFEGNKKIKIENFYKDYRYAFLGVKKGTQLSSINYSNFFNHLYSDHIPIYMDFEIEGINNRVLFSNNLSINTSRGVNNNMKLFKIKDKKKLDNISNKQITNFVINQIENLYKKLGINYEKKELDKNPQKNIDYLKKTLLTIDFDKLKSNSKKNNSKKNNSKKNNSKKSKKKSKRKTGKTLFQKNWDKTDNCIKVY